MGKWNFTKGTVIVGGCDSDGSRSTIRRSSAEDVVGAVKRYTKLFGGACVDWTLAPYDEMIFHRQNDPNDNAILVF